MVLAKVLQAEFKLIPSKSVICPPKIKTAKTSQLATKWWCVFQK